MFAGVSVRKTLFFVVLVAGLGLLSPIAVRAFDNMSDTIPPPMGCGGDGSCPCMKKIDPQTGQCTQQGMGVLGCTCVDPGSGVKGTCVAAGHCHGESFPSQSGQQGGGLGMQQLMQALQGIMGALKGGGGGGGGGGGSGSGNQSGTGTGSQGCTSYYQTSDQNTTDPCAYYVPTYTGDQFTSGTGSTSGNGTVTLPNGSTVQSGCTTYYQTSVQNNPDPCTYYVAAGQSGGTSGSGSTGSQSASSGSSGSDNGCTSYTQTTNPNDSDPCTYYVPAGGVGASAASGGTAIGSENSGSASDAGGGNAFSDAVSSIGNDTSGADSNAATNDNSGVTVNGGQTGDIFTNLLDTLAKIGGGAQGSINLTGNGATIFAGGRDTQNNTTAAGFYGSNTFGSQPQGLVARLCYSRPWAGGLVSAIIPPTFFDNLCQWRGYQVGSQNPASGNSNPLVQLQTVVLKSPTAGPEGQASSSQETSVHPLNPPIVGIRALPPAVSVGGRTSIFWASQNATSCLVTSSDGSFHETAVSGAASTVPLAKATTFTITCTAKDTSIASASVLVTIAI